MLGGMTKVGPQQRDEPHGGSSKAIQNFRPQPWIMDLCSDTFSTKVNLPECSDIKRVCMVVREPPAIILGLR